MILGTFSLTGFMLRWGIAILLVAGTINPSGVSYYHWISGPEGLDQALQGKLLVGGLLAVGYIIYLRATWRSIGAVGVGLGTFIAATVLWWLVERGWLDLANSSVASWTAIVVVATIMGFGLSWSFIRRALSGQIDGTTGGG